MRAIFRSTLVALALSASCTTDYENIQSSTATASASSSTSSAGTGGSTSGAAGATAASSGGGGTNATGAGGCAADLASDAANCGACGHACSTDNTTLATKCVLGACTPSCAQGFADCSAPRAPADDDGCETKADTADHCGSCGNVCPAGFVCDSGSSKIECNCASSACGGSKSVCDQGHCMCGTGAMQVTCEEGEACAGDKCQCNGGPPCDQLTCCQIPPGCKDLEADVNNCGACGHACPSAWFCCSGECSDQSCG